MGLNQKQTSCSVKAPAWGPSSSWSTLLVPSYYAEGAARLSSATFRCGTDTSPLLSFAVHVNLLAFQQTQRKACAGCRRMLQILAGRWQIKWQWYREEKGVLERRQAWGFIWRCGTPRLCVPVRPAEWSLISQAFVRWTSKLCFALLQSTVKGCSK